MERGSKRPDRPVLCHATVRAAVAEAARQAPTLAPMKIPMLFLQGTRDELATLELLQPVIDRLGARATLKLLQDADHSFHVPARTGRKDAEVRAEMLDALTTWIEKTIQSP
jgi:alpha-beta hydrolase superfamily lysophospholipase